MIGSITPLVQAARGTKRWQKTALAYAAGSVMASVMIGSALGGIGRLAGNLVGHRWVDRYLALVAVAVGMALIELGALPRPPALIRRQTDKLWRARHGPALSAFLWGLDIGFGLTTRVTFASYWVLVAACLVIAHPMEGAMLMGGYGLGRAALVATGPLLVSRQGLVSVGAELFRDERAWHRLHGWMLAAMAAMLLLIRPW